MNKTAKHFCLHETCIVLQKKVDKINKMCHLLGSHSAKENKNARKICDVSILRSVARRTLIKVILNKDLKEMLALASHVAF